MSSSERTSSDDNNQPTLRHTPVNRPVLGHTSSKQSISATEEYDTAESPTGPLESNKSYDDGEVHEELNQSFLTPPTSPREYNDRLREVGDTSASGSSSAHRQLKMLPSTQAALRRLQGEDNPFNAADANTQSSLGQALGTTEVREGDSRGAEARSSQIRRKPVGSALRDSGPKLTQLNTDPGPPTPGVDDTPYIQFALDQLTRDEDVRGSRNYPGNIAGLTIDYAEEHGSLPVLGHGENENLGGVPRTSSLYSDRALATAALIERTPGQYNARQPDEYLDYTDPREPLVGHLYGSGNISQANASDPLLYVDASEYITQVSPPTTQPKNRPEAPQQPISGNSDIQPDFFIPIYQEIVPLRFLPGILRPIWLSIYILLTLLILALLLTTGIYSGTHDGLYSYTHFGGSRYFIFKYLPTLIGMTMLLWLFQIQIAIQRIVPFIAMASLSSKSRSGAPLLDWLPTNFILPKISYFTMGMPVIGCILSVFWLQIFSIPLFATIFNVYYYGVSPNGEWKWVTVQGIVWTLFSLYLLLLISLVALAIWLWGKRTGLKWDPRSLGDLIALMDRSNILRQFTNSEVFQDSTQFRERFATASFRLGYWSTRYKPADMFYGIGEEGSVTRQYSLEAGRLAEQPPDRTAFSEQQRLDLESSDESKHIRRYLPWYIKPMVALFWVLLALVLYLAFLIVSFVDQAVVRGFNPLLAVDVDAAGFSSANFFYSFIPTLIAELLFLGWLSIDYAFRRLQPFSAMSTNTDGASAKECLLLDYPFRFPGEVTLVSLLSGQVRIAWFSFVTLIAASFPILAAGTFWAQFYISTQTVRISVHTSGYYTLCVFLALFVFTLPLVLIGLRKRYLPHSCTTIAENVSWLYVSGIVGEREWRATLGSKAEIIARLMSPMTERERRSDFSPRHHRRSSAKARLTGGSGEGRFIFGRFTGRDGLQHIGIERIGRGEKRTSLAEKSLRDGRTTSGSWMRSARAKQQTTRITEPNINVTQPQRSFVSPRELGSAARTRHHVFGPSALSPSTNENSNKLLMPDFKRPEMTTLRGRMHNDIPPAGYI